MKNARLIALVGTSALLIACSPAVDEGQSKSPSADIEAKSVTADDGATHTVVARRSDNAMVLELDSTKGSELQSFSLPDGRSGTLEVQGEVGQQGQLSVDFATHLSSEPVGTAIEVHCIAIGFNGGTCWCFACTGQPNTCYGACGG